MNIEYIKNQIKKIVEADGDDELQHVLEDKLQLDFIRFVAEEGEEPFKTIAKEVLKTEDIDFARWCA